MKIKLKTQNFWAPKGAIQSLTPFDQADPPFVQVVRASDKLKLLFSGKSVEVHVKDRTPARILLNQGVGGAGEDFTDAEVAGKNLTKGRFTCTERAVQKDDRPRTQTLSKAFAKGP